MSVPMEVIAAPLTVYVAPAGTTAPDVDVSIDISVIDASWTKLGTSGTKNYSEKGVVVTHDQTIVTWKPAGSTGARKAFRTEEFVTIEVELVDLTIEQYAITLNNATVDVSALFSSVQLQQGPTVATFAIAAIGLSPVNESLNAMYYSPLVFQAENPAPAYAAAGVPAMLACKFQTLEDDSGGFGQYFEQHTDS